MRRLVCTALVAFFTLHATPARAHTVGVSRGLYRVSGSSVEAELVFARPELAAAIPGLDADRDGSISAAEVAGAGPLLADTIVRGLEARTPSGPCGGVFEGAALTEQDGFAIRAAYRCRRELETVSIRLALLGSFSLGHRHLASATAPDGETVRAVLYESRSEFQVVPSHVAAAAAGAAATVAWPLFRLGIQHILTGYDHLLFLLGLILVGGRLRPLLVVVTAFTVAHSMTLGLAALGVWAPSPRIVEPAIALSIAYVGVENWFVRDAARRWLITFPFGLAHGFSFAGVLRDISLPSSQVPLALASFNVGVEFGQLAVLAFVLPAVMWLGRSRRFADRGVKAMSAAIAVAGLFWFVSRLR